MCNDRLLSASARVPRAASGARPALNCAASSSSTRAVSTGAAPAGEADFSVSDSAFAVLALGLALSTSARCTSAAVQRRPAKASPSPSKPVSAPRLEPVSTPTGSLPMSTPKPRPSSGSQERILPVARGAARALCLPRSASMRSSACSAARSRLVASGAPALSLMRRLSCRSCRRSRLCGRIRALFSSSWAQARCAGAPQEVTVARACMKRRISSAHRLCP